MRLLYKQFQSIGQILHEPCFPVLLPVFQFTNTSPGRAPILASFVSVDASAIGLESPLISTLKILEGGTCGNTELGPKGGAGRAGWAPDSGVHRPGLGGLPAPGVECEDHSRPQGIFSSKARRPRLLLLLHQDPNMGGDKSTKYAFSNHIWLLWPHQITLFTQTSLNLQSLSHSYTLGGSTVFKELKYNVIIPTQVNQVQKIFIYKVVHT